MRSINRVMAAHFSPLLSYSGAIFNRPGVAGAVLQTDLSLSDSFIDSFIEWSFSPRSSNHFHAQNVWARELKFWEKVHPRPWVTCSFSHVTCQVSCVTCHVSLVMCHKSHFFLFFTKWWSLSMEGLLSMWPTRSSLIAFCLSNSSASAEYTIRRQL